MRNSILLAPLALLLAACGGPTVLPGDRSAQRLAWESMVFAAAQGPVLVETAGQVAGTTPPAAMAAEAMTGAVFGYPATFTADPLRAPQPNFRTVLVFNPAPNLTERQACAGDLAVLAGPPPGRAGLFMAFCSNVRPLQSVRGSVDGVAGPADPALVALIRHATTQLFQPPVYDRGRADVFEAFAR